MNQDGMLKPALIGGVLLGVLSAVPVVSAVNCVCCAWVIGGGVLAASLYVKSSPAPVTLGRGVTLGLLTGLIGAVADTLLTIPLHFALAGIGMDFAQSMEQVLEQVPNLPADTRDTLRSIFTAGGPLSVFFIVASGFFKVVVYSLMAMLGGTIGVAIFEKRKTGHPGAGPACGISLTGRLSAPCGVSSTSSAATAAGCRKLMHAGSCGAGRMGPCGSARTVCPLRSDSRPFIGQSASFRRASASLDIFPRKSDCVRSYSLTHS